MFTSIGDSPNSYIEASCGPVEKGPLLIHKFQLVTLKSEQVK